MRMKFVFDDGGRAAAGFKRHTNDCVARAIAIATGQPYRLVLSRLTEGIQTQRLGRKGQKKDTSIAQGVRIQRKWFKDYMKSLGWAWTPTMGIGTGCKVHLQSGELPTGRLIVNVSQHLVAVIDGVCQELDVDFFSCRGYTSQSEMWSAAMRLKNYWKHYNQDTLVLHFGDHDPSGIDMTRDIQDRLQEFAFGPGGHKIELRRLALNMDQIEQYNPPPNPAKLSDSRCENYIKEHGEKSWELDALEPRVIADLIRNEIMAARDADKWAASVEKEDEHKRLLKTVSDKWDEITEDL